MTTMLRRPLLFAPLALLVCAGCPIKGSGDKTEETRALESFSELEVDGSIDVFVKVGAPASVRLEGDANILPMIKTEVVGDRLRIFTKGSFITTHGLSAHVTTESLNRIAVSGSSDVRADDLDAESLVFDVSGSGDLVATGKAQSLTIAVSGSGEVDAGAIPVQTAEVSVSGSGDVLVHVTETLKASVSGSGDVRYRGEPKTVDDAVSGSGSVKPL